MVGNNTPARIYSSLTVRTYPMVAYYDRDVLMVDAHEGLDEQLFEQLTASPAEPFLLGLKELFINFWGAFNRSIQSDVF